MDSQAVPSKFNLDLDLEDFICPITGYIFRDPVIASDGRIYEKEAISKWLNQNGTSPFTRERISKEVHSCLYIKTAIETLLKKNPELENLLHKKDNTYKSNIRDIIDYINKDMYDKLLNYTEFDPIPYITTKKGSDKFVIHILGYCKDNNVVKHVINNRIDKNNQEINMRIMEYICRISNLDIFKYGIEIGLPLSTKFIIYICKNNNLKNEKECYKIFLSKCRDIEPTIIYEVIIKNCYFEIIKFVTQELGMFNIEFRTEEIITNWHTFFKYISYDNFIMMFTGNSKFVKELFLKFSRSQLESIFANVDKNILDFLVQNILDVVFNPIRQNYNNLIFIILERKNFFSYNSETFECIINKFIQNSNCYTLEQQKELVKLIMSKSPNWDSSVKRVIDKYIHLIDLELLKKISKENHIPSERESIEYLINKSYQYHKEEDVEIFRILWNDNDGFYDYIMHQKNISTRDILYLCNLMASLTGDYFKKSKIS